MTCSGSGKVLKMPLIWTILVVPFKIEASLAVYGGHGNRGKTAFVRPVIPRDARAVDYYYPLRKDR
jgi:hypothetical protein